MMTTSKIATIWAAPRLRVRSLPGASVREQMSAAKILRLVPGA
jgi:hypothetical protein